MSGTLTIQKDSITKLNMDCIVNAANEWLQQGGGVCGAIFAAAGARELQKACDRHGGCPTGQAVITPGFRLKAKYVIHAVGPRWNGGNQGEAEQLRSCYRASLQLAMENGCHSIAFPLISSGIFGYPKQEAWEIAIRTICEFLQAHTDYDLQVMIAVLDDAALQLGNRVLQELRPAQ